MKDGIWEVGEYSTMGHLLGVWKGARWASAGLGVDVSNGSRAA